MLISNGVVICIFKQFTFSNEKASTIAATRKMELIPCLEQIIHRQNRGMILLCGTYGTLSFYFRKCGLTPDDQSMPPFYSYVLLNFNI